MSIEGIFTALIGGILTISTIAVVWMMIHAPEGEEIPYVGFVRKDRGDDD